MTWEVKIADAIVEPGDVLICPANAFLNLSGGVGGEILLRHGDAMQRELHGWLAASGRRFVQQGEVVCSGGHGTRFRAVLHAVAVDGMYETSGEVVGALVDRALKLAAEMKPVVLSVVLTALGTGFGRMKMADFARGVAALQGRKYGAVERVTLCVRKSHEAEEVRRAWGL